MINKDKRKYFTAGELAAIFNISKQSLLYYDKVNLLSPDFVSENGYRNYSIQQFLDLEIIVNLRALDISIANIKKYLEDRSKEHFLQLLQEKTAECQAIIHNNQEICDTIERIKEDMHVKELNTCRHLTLSWQNDRLLRLTPLAESDDGKSRIPSLPAMGKDARITRELCLIMPVGFWIRRAFLKRMIFCIHRHIFPASPAPPSIGSPSK